MTPKQVNILREAAEAVCRLRSVTGRLDGQGPALLAAAKAHLGVTQGTLAGRLNVSDTYLSKIARGHEPMSPDLASRLSDLVEL